MKTELMKMLDKYAQASGFADLADLKSNYTHKAYEAVLASMLRRAKTELEAAQ